MPDFVAYYRVSTDRQGMSGLDAQPASVMRFLAPTKRFRRVYRD
jgi:hypothetical protein